MSVKYFVLLCFVSCGSSIPFVPNGNSSDVPNVCCVQNEWESHLFLDSGIVFIDANTAFTYFNGTIHTAYSYDRQKLYYGITITEMSPLIPHPFTQTKTILADYAMGVSYSVTGGECDKEEIDDKMQRLCIPNDATLLSTGEFGDEDRVLETYQFTTTTDIQWQITASVFIDRLKPVTPKMCQPFHASYFTPSANPDSGTLYSYDVMDFGPIKSTDVFNIPEPCKHLINKTD